MNRILAVLALVSGLAGCLPAQTQTTRTDTGSQQAATDAGSQPINLVLLIAVDQMRGDYLKRYESQFRGGFARLTRGGAWFTNAHHDHAITETAPGHATMLSGRFPRSTGISQDVDGVQDPSSPIVDGYLGDGASPFRFHGTTLVDWLIAKDSRSRALSVSEKDRSAILPIGKSKQNVYWYSYDGAFTTSNYYMAHLPPWVVQFNARDLARRFAGKSWNLLLPESAYPEQDTVFEEGDGEDIVFPHVLSSDSTIAAYLIIRTPWIDEITLDFALQGVNALSIGTGPQTDVLSISLTGTDPIGHKFGPDSREIHDQMLQLDKMLGGFFDSLFKIRDSTRIIIALTGDHGMSPIPELAQKSRPIPIRIHLAPVIQKTRQRLRAMRVDTTAVTFGAHTVRADRRAFGGGAKSAAIDALIDSIASDLRKLPGIQSVNRMRDFAKADTLTDSIARRWLHNFNVDDSVDLVITPQPLSAITGNTAAHGSPYTLDTWVPLIFYGAPFRAGRFTDFVRTVDLAPTLAAVVNVRPLEKLDGVVLTKALK